MLLLLQQTLSLKDTFCPHITAIEVLVHNLALNCLLRVNIQTIVQLAVNKLHALPCHVD